MAALPSLRQLRYLVAVADRLNFRQAAHDCFVTQSTLSAGLKELETQLGVELVERDTSLLERLRHNIARIRSGLSGTRVACV